MPDRICSRRLLVVTDHTSNGVGVDPPVVRLVAFIFALAAVAAGVPVSSMLALIPGGVIVAVAVLTIIGAAAGRSSND